MRLKKTLLAATTVVATVLTSTALAVPQAYAANAHMYGIVTCLNGNAPEGVYVTNTTSASRSGWANMWGGSGNWKYYAYDGAYTTDYVRARVGCGNNWNPTYVSDNAPSTWFGSLNCAKEGLNYHCYLL